MRYHENKILLIWNKISQHVHTVCTDLEIKIHTHTHTRSQFHIMLIFPSFPWPEDNKTKNLKVQMCSWSPHGVENELCCYQTLYNICWQDVHISNYSAQTVLSCSKSPADQLLYDFSTPPTSIPSVCSIRACDQSTHTQTNMHMNSHALLHTFNRGVEKVDVHT